MIIKDILRFGEKELDETSSTSILDTQILSEHFLKVDKKYLITNSDKKINIKREKEIREAIQKRKEGAPIAYIINKKEFFSREFYVNERVLIPRPETEELIEYVLDLVDKRRSKSFLNNSIPKQELGNKKERAQEPGNKKIQNKNSVTLSLSKCPDKTQDDSNFPLHILDLGTGSGCIACTMKLERPELQVYASDISKNALEVAKKNSKNLGADITFIKSDLLSFKQKLKECHPEFISGSQATKPNYPAEILKQVQNNREHQASYFFHIIIANLPYVQESAKHPSIKQEPDTALYSGVDGLDHYRRLSKQISKDICKHLIIEIDDKQAEKIPSIFPQAESVKIIKDFAGLKRIGHIIF